MVEFVPLLFLSELKELIYIYIYIYKERDRERDRERERWGGRKKPKTRNGKKNIVLLKIPKNKRYFQMRITRLSFFLFPHINE